MPCDASVRGNLGGRIREKLAEIAARSGYAGNADVAMVDEMADAIGVLLAPVLAEADNGVDWRGVVDRASAVAVGAGAPDDGATLPEQVEWLAARLHGPSLRAPDGPSLPLEIPDDAHPGDLVRWTVVAGRVESVVVERRIQERPFGRPFGQ